MSYQTNSTIFGIVEGMTSTAHAFPKESGVLAQLAEQLRTSSYFAPIIETASPSFSATLRPVIEENTITFFNRTGTWRGEQPIEAISLLPQFLSDHELVQLAAPMHSFPATLWRAIMLGLGLAAAAVLIGHYLNDWGTGWLLASVLLVGAPVYRLMQYKQSVDDRRRTAKLLEKRAAAVDEVLFPQS